jgi:hypothetical protein
MPRAIQLQLFAELSARMQAGDKKSDVLASAKVEDADWDQSQEFWLGKMAAEAQKGRFALSQKYAALHQAAAAKLAAASQAAVELQPARKRAVSPQVVVHAIPLAGRPPSPQATSATDSPSPVAVPPSIAAASPAPASVPPPPSTPPSAIVAYTARLTVEQLAAMRAEVATSPEGDHPAVLQRFGLDAATWELEEAHWQRRLATAPDLFQRYLRQFQYCRSLLQRT